MKITKIIKNLITPSGSTSKEIHLNLVLALSDEMTYEAFNEMKVDIRKALVDAVFPEVKLEMLKQTKTTLFLNEIRKELVTKFLNEK